MTRGGELSLCDCCTLVVANSDESGCRDFHGHTHDACSVPFHTVMDGDAVESARGFTCDGCGEDQGAYANQWPAVVLVSEKVSDDVDSSSDQAPEKLSGYCNGCGHTFKGTRGLKSHQSRPFIAMGCRP